MDQPIDINFFRYFLIVFTASLAGSLHCVGMCGGILFALPSTKSAHIQYHVGRLAGYLFLAIIAGFLGKTIFYKIQTPLISLSVTLLIASIMIWSGIKSFKGNSFHIPLPNLFKFGTGFRHKPLGSFFVGLFTPFIPCGWLHTFILGSVTLASPSKNALVMVAFWSGTVPALALGKQLIEKLIMPLRFSAPKIIALCLISFGIITASAKTSEFILHSKGTAGAELQCHTK